MEEKASIESQNGQNYIRGQRKRFLIYGEIDKELVKSVSASGGKIYNRSKLRHLADGGVMLAKIVEVTEDS